jgi:hypothetical protein
VNQSNHKAGGRANNFHHHWRFEQVFLFCRFIEVFQCLTLLVLQKDVDVFESGRKYQSNCSDRTVCGGHRPFNGVQLFSSGVVINLLKDLKLQTAWFQLARAVNNGLI